MVNPFRWKGETWFYVAVAVLASAPAWIVKYPPIEDLPFHIAATRVIHNYGDPSYGFQEHFKLTFGRTQYVVYYLIASLLAYVLGVVKANIALMCVYLGGTVLALRELLRALGRDQRLCLLVVPLLYNVMFFFGLLPFLLGIPTMFFALATAVRYFENPEPKRGVLLAVLSSLLFYSHVFPFGIFGLGFAAMFPWTKPRRWIGAGLPVVPALLLLLRWTLFTDAGKLSRGALSPTSEDGVVALNHALPGAFQWLTDVFPDVTDERVLIGFFILAVLLLGLSAGDKDRAKPVAIPYVLLPIACILFYFSLGQGHGYIWLISQRFPVLFLMTAIPLLRMPEGVRGQIASALMVGLGFHASVNTCQHFIRFQLEEVGDLDGAIAEIPKAQKVAALIYDKNSAIVNWAPFLHFGSYYQVQKGGVLQFTYAGYAHWPFDFREGKYPPPGGPARPRWEWTPEQVSVRSELAPYYDYVLVRGNGFSPQDAFRLKWRGDRWSVWERAR